MSSNNSPKWPGWVWIVAGIVAIVVGMDSIGLSFRVIGGIWGIAVGLFLFISGGIYVFSQEKV